MLIAAGWTACGVHPPCFCQPGTFDFQTLVFPVAGHVSDVHAVDVNGDGRCDLVVLFVSPAGGEGESLPERRASVYLQSEQGFSPRPFQTVALDRKETLCQWANVQGGPAPEWVFLTPEGMRVRAWSDSSGFSAAPVLVLRCGSAFQTHDASRLPPWTLVGDLDGDRTFEWCIPQTDRIDLHGPDESGGLQLLQSLRIEPDVELSGETFVSLRMRLPRLVSGRFDDDPWPDVFVLQRGRMSVFLGQAPGGGALREAEVQYLFGPSLEGAAARTDGAPLFELTDWNGDGLLDLIDVRTEGMFRLHVNRSGRYDPVPDASWATEGPCLTHALRDFNRDGLGDLGLVELNTGAAGIVPFLLRQKIRIFFKCFAGRTQGYFSQKPDFSLSFSQRFAWQNGLNQKVFCLFDGDLNGDGRNDLAAGTDANVLTVFPAEENGYFGKKDAFRIPAAWSERCRAADMNRDGISDLIFWYPQGAGGPDRFILVQSRRPDGP
jgi:hypothetical protein